MIRKPSGFTIVELLVVIAIIGILVALLMPAIQSARESARQSSCQNSLKQIGTAVASHVSTLGRYPTGGWNSYSWIGDPDQGNGQAQPGGWIFNLLPYMDQQILHDYGSISTMSGSANSTDWREAGNVVRTMTTLPAFNCPSRRRAVDYPAYANPVGSTPFLPFAITTAAPASTYPANSTANTGIFTGMLKPWTSVARSDYAINSGDTSVAPASLCEPASAGSAIPSSVLSSFGTGKPIPGAPASASQYQSWFNANTGVCFQQSMIQPTHITDGAAYTMLVGEKYLRPERYTIASPFTTGDSPPMGDLMNMYSGATWDTLRTTNVAPTQDTLGYDGTCSFCSDKNSNANFGSAHPNGVWFVFCDSSVKLIKYGIKLQVYQALSNRLDATQSNTTTTPPVLIDDSIFK